MVVTINNISTDLSPNTTLAEALKAFGLATPNGIAVAVNQQVIPQKLWNDTTLKENDNVLVIVPTQGG